MKIPPKKESRTYYERARERFDNNPIFAWTSLIVGGLSALAVVVGFIFKVYDEYDKLFPRTALVLKAKQSDLQVQVYGSVPLDLEIAGASENSISILIDDATVQLAVTDIGGEAEGFRVPESMLEGIIGQRTSSFAVPILDAQHVRQELKIDLSCRTAGKFQITAKLTALKEKLSYTTVAHLTVHPQILKVQRDVADLSPHLLYENQFGVVIPDEVNGGSVAKASLWFVPDAAIAMGGAFLKVSRLLTDSSRRQNQEDASSNLEDVVERKGSLEQLGTLATGEGILAPIGANLYKVTASSDSILHFERLSIERCPTILSLPVGDIDAPPREVLEKARGIRFGTQSSMGADGDTLAIELTLDGKEYSKNESHTFGTENDFPIFVCVNKGDTRDFLRIDLVTDDKIFEVRDCGFLGSESGEPVSGERCQN